VDDAPYLSTPEEGLDPALLVALGSLKLKAPLQNR
jgi:hypothetical protein